MFQVFPPASHFNTLPHHRPKLWGEFIFIWWFIIHPLHQQTLALASFVPPAFNPRFIFPSRLSPSFALIPFTTRCSSVILSHRNLLRNSHQDTDTQMKSSRASIPGPCPTSLPGSSWPYCRRATDGLLAQSGWAAPLSRSRCLLPLDICPRDGAGWMGIGGEGGGY